MLKVMMLNVMYADDGDADDADHAAAGHDCYCGGGVDDANHFGGALRAILAVFATGCA